MNVLLGCEESQAVCIEMRALGHNAFSCDLEECSGGHPEWHIIADVLTVINGGYFKTQAGNTVFIEKWDMGIFFPPCTRICNSGVLRLYRNGKKENGIDPVKWEEMVAGATFFKNLLDADCDCIVMENPVPHGYAMKIIGKKYDQIIQPYNFGEDASKATCLWLKGVPKLRNTGYCKPRIANGKKRWSNQTDSGQNKLAPSATRGKDRAKTYVGIAKAMARQWT